MPARLAYGDDLGACFGLDSAPVLVSRMLGKTTIAVTEVRCDSALNDLTTPMPTEDSFFVALQIREYPRHELHRNGKPIQIGPFASQTTSFYDLKDEPVARLDHPSHAVFFYIPRAALDLIADRATARHIETLRLQTGAVVDDPLIRHLTSALFPALARPEEASTLFVDYVTSAIAAHITATYGDMASTRRRRGGLTPWQERRAKEMIAARLDGDVSLADLARECGLSVSHFARAFRGTTGVPPHRWLLGQRIAKAKELLRNSPLSLSETALACGFADQSHFTATFTRAIGTSPGAWRRAQKARG